MENLTLNQTPIRTSRNYGINNIKLENIEMPENVNTFNGLQISGDTDKFTISNDKKDNSVKFGNGDVLKNQIKEMSNKDIQIYVQNNATKEIELDFNFSKENKDLIDNILINIEENAKGTIIIKYYSEDDLKYYHNGQIKIIANKGSKVNIILINLLNNQSNNFLSIENILEEKTDVNYTIVDFGGKNSITNYYTNLKGKEANNKVSTIYLGNKDQVLDLNYIAEVYGEKSNIEMNLKGAIKDNAKKHFKGTIDFKTGCKKAKGNENEYCTILSKAAKSIALPMLLCTEEDVEGNHSAAAGKIDPKQLFYIMSRGFDMVDAQKLIIRASFNEVLESVSKEELREEIFEKIDEKLK